MAQQRDIKDLIAPMTITELELIADQLNDGKAWGAQDHLAQVAGISKSAVSAWFSEPQAMRSYLVRYVRMLYIVTVDQDFNANMIEQASFAQVGPEELRKLAEDMNPRGIMGLYYNLSAICAVGRTTVSGWVKEPKKIRPHTARYLRLMRAAIVQQRAQGREYVIELLARSWRPVTRGQES